MLAGLLIMAVVLGCTVGGCVVVWQRVNELDEDWPQEPVAMPVWKTTELAPEPQPAQSETVAIINAILAGIADIYNPRIVHPLTPPLTDDDVPPEEEYDPFAEFDREMMESLGETDGTVD